MSASSHTPSPEAQQQPVQHTATTASTLTPLELEPISATSTTPVSVSVPSSVLNLYLGAGAVLLTVGVALGIRVGNRQAAQLERDNPPPAHAPKTKQPPPITPQQRKAAFRATLGALGLGTLLCAGFGGALVYGVGRYYGTSSLPSHVASVRSSIASTQWGSWIRSKGSVDSTSEQQDQLSPQEAREVEQATAFLKELEADYQRFVADMNKRRQSEAEMAEIDESRKS